MTEEAGKKGEVGKKNSSPSSSSSIWSVFMHADWVDMWLMTLGFLGSVGDGLGTPVMLLLTSKLLNNLGNFGPDTMSSFIIDINKSIVYLLYLSCTYCVTCFLEGYCWTRTAERQASRMRASYLKAVLRQDMQYFDLKSDNTSQVVTSVSSDSLVIQEVLSEKVPNFVMNASTFFGSYITAFSLMWRLTLVAFPSIILLIIPGLMYGRILIGLARKIRDEYDKAGTIVEQAVSSVRTVYSFVGEKKTMAEFSRALEGSVKLGLKQGMTKGVAIGSNSITFSIWAFMSWYGSRLVMYHGEQGGTVFAAGASVILGGLSLGSGLSNVKYFAEAASAGERIMQVMKRVPKIDSENANGMVLDDVTGELEFQKVEFTYPSRPEIPIFESFNLRVPAGKTVALVGGSGSGKSTMISLLQRFYDPAGGQILLDGMDIKKLQLKWLRSQMGLVSQEPVLFATSIKENILFGKEDATMEEVVAASKAANAHNFISQLPQGYGTQVGERGVQMSGGQKQRIAIARAVIKSPKILLLDEATSALDSESERIVQEAIDVAAVGRTTILIAHRLSTIRNAEIIAVVNAGRVVETGTHHELSANPDGPYASLVHLQEQSGGANSIREATGTGSSSLSAGGHSRSQRRSSHNMGQRLSSAALSRSSSTDSFHHSGNQHDQTGEPKESTTPPPVPSFRRLLALNLPEWRQAVLGCLSAILFGAIQPLYAYALGSTISDYFLTDHDEIKSKTRTYSFIFLSLTFFSFAINIGQHYNFASMGEHLNKRVRERMLSKILTFEVAWFDQDDNSTGAICSRLCNDASVVRSLVGDRMALLIQATSAVTIACAMGLAIAWRLAIVMIAVQPLIIVCFFARCVLLRSMSSKAIKAQAESGKLAAEAVSNVHTVTAFSSQDRILHLFDRAQDGPRQESVKQSWFAGIGLGASQSLMTCTWALDFWYGSKLVSQGYITSKAVLQTFLILVSTGRVIADAGSMTTDLAKGADAVGSVFDVFDRHTRIEPEDPEGHQLDKVQGEVEFRDVHFVYPSRPDVNIFQCFSLSIESGNSTALVGQSGSGKSTVIALIERFYDPTQGTILIDRKDIKSYHLRALRRHIALVGQEPTLFSGTIGENIAYGAALDNVTEAEVESAARAANAHDFITALKEGYDTWCSDRGLQLSGGQKQRIAIARAILKNPAILLLDEATSALDSQSESVVQEALDRVMVGRTSVVVAHRLSTVQNCDVIAVLDNGEVVEKGSHRGLMAKGKSGAYHSLVALQQQQRQPPGGFH